MFCKATCNECVAVVVVAATPLSVLPPSSIASCCCCCCARADNCGGWQTAVDTTLSGDRFGTADIVAEADKEKLGSEEGKWPLAPAAGTVEELEWPDAAEEEEVVAEVVAAAAVGVRD